MEDTMNVTQLDHLNLSVADLDMSLAWYARVFGFAKVEEGTQETGRWAIIRAGEAMLCLYEQPQREHLDRFALRGRGLHGLNHFGLRIGDREAWEQTIADEQVDLSYGGAIEWPHSTAWYVVDPTGYEVEVACWHHDTVSFEFGGAETGATSTSL